MTHLYNCRHSGDQYRITKFDTDLNPIEGSSYLTTLTECDCPAGHRDTCRHRKMLPLFIKSNAVDAAIFYNHDHMIWIDVPDFSEGNQPDELVLEDEADDAEFSEESETGPAPEPTEAELAAFASSYVPEEPTPTPRPEVPPIAKPDRSALRRI